MIPSGSDWYFLILVYDLTFVCVSTVYVITKIGPEWESAYDRYCISSRV